MVEKICRDFFDFGTKTSFVCKKSNALQFPVV